MSTKKVKSDHPKIKIDNSLEQYKGKVVFKEKFDLANKMLKITGLPKSLKKHP